MTENHVLPLQYAVIVLLVCLAAGLVSWFSPTTVVYLFYRFARANTLFLFTEEDIDPRLQRAMHLIEEDPDQHAEEFGATIAIARVSGLILLLIAVVGACGLVLQTGTQ